MLKGIVICDIDLEITNSSQHYENYSYIQLLGNLEIDKNFIFCKEFPVIYEGRNGFTCIILPHYYSTPEKEKLLPDITPISYNISDIFCIVFDASRKIILYTRVCLIAFLRDQYSQNIDTLVKEIPWPFGINIWHATKDMRFDPDNPKCYIEITNKPTYEIIKVMIDKCDWMHTSNKSYWLPSLYVNENIITCAFFNKDTVLDPRITEKNIVRAQYKS